MKRFLLVVVGLFILAIALAGGYDMLNLWLMRRTSSNVAVRIERALSGGRQGEVAIFGSSRALGNFYPSVISSQAFDYGVNGMGLMETLRLVKVYLEKNPKGIVIINLDPWGFSYSGGGLSANLVGDYRLVEGSRHVRDALRLEDVHWSDWMPGIRFQGALRNTLASYINARKAVTKKIDAGAELALTSRSEQEWKVINAKLRRFDWNVYDEGMKLLSEALAAGRNAQLVLVVGPVSPFKRGLYDGRSKLESFLDEQRRHPGILVLNYFDREEFESSDFADPDHLNIYGAEKFSALLRDDLTEAVPSFR